MQKIRKRSIGSRVRPDLLETQSQVVIQRQEKALISLLMIRYIGDVDEDRMKLIDGSSLRWPKMILTHNWWTHYIIRLCFSYPHISW